jgi:hypothetical protein
LDEVLADNAALRRRAHVFSTRHLVAVERLLAEQAEAWRAREIAPREALDALVHGFHFTAGTLLHTQRAVGGARLTAQVDFIGCDSSKCQYSWYRGGALVLEGQPFYVPTFDDIGHDLEVRVTPVGKFPDGQARVGEAKSGSSSSPIALPDDVQKMVVGWVEIGQRRFEGLLELDKGSEKDRQLLFEKQKVKLRDGKGTTLSKPDDYKGVSIKFDKDPRTFTLITRSQVSRLMSSMGLPPELVTAPLLTKPSKPPSHCAAWAVASVMAAGSDKSMGR